MHALVYHVPMFIKTLNNFRQFTGQGTEKNNDDAKKIYLQNSDKWDAVWDVLLLEHRQGALKHRNRQKRTYNIRNAVYWEDGITETWKKQIKACLRELLANLKEAEVPESNLIEEEYNKMTVNWIRQEIKSKHFTAPGIARMKKCPLVELLKKN